MMKAAHGAGLLAVLMASAVWAASIWQPTHFIADDKPPIVLEELFPKEMNGWVIDRSIVPIQPSPDLQKVIDETYDQTLARTYRNAQGQRIMFAVAYGRNQHEGMNTHRPEICYPAQGLPILRDGEQSTLTLGRAALDVTRIVAGNSRRVEPITYWLIVGDRVTHFGRGHKLVTLKYGLVGQIPDGMLVRVSSIDADTGGAFALHDRFVADMLSSMSEANLRLLLGRAIGEAGRAL